MVAEEGVDPAEHLLLVAQPAADDGAGEAPADGLGEDVGDDLAAERGGVELAWTGMGIKWRSTSAT